MQAKVVQMNPLTGKEHLKETIAPDKSDLSDYEALFK